MWEKQTKQLSDFLKNLPGDTARKIEEANREIYRRTNMVGRGDTSYCPVEFDDGTPRGVKESARICIISLPAEINLGGGFGWYPALKNINPMINFDQLQPNIKLVLNEGSTKVYGDEVVLLSAEGRSADLFTRGKNFVAWKVFQAGEVEDLLSIKQQYEFVGGPNFKPTRISAMDMTADHVVHFLATRLYEASGRRIRIHPDHLFTALDMLTQKSPSLRHRWEMLNDRVKMQYYAGKYPEVVAGIFDSCVPIAEDDFGNFCESMRMGEISTWGQMMKKMDEVGEVGLLGTSALVAAVNRHAMTLETADQSIQAIRKSKASILLSSTGIRYIVTLLDSYDSHLVKLQEELGLKAAEAQKLALENVIKRLSIRVDAWKAANEALGKGRDQVMVPQIQAAVREAVTEDAQSMVKLIRRAGDKFEESGVIDGEVIKRPGASESNSIDDLVSRSMGASSVTKGFAPSPTMGGEKINE